MITFGYKMLKNRINFSKWQSSLTCVCLEHYRKFFWIVDKYFKLFLCQGCSWEQRKGSNSKWSKPVPTRSNLLTTSLFHDKYQINLIKKKLWCIHGCVKNELEFHRKLMVLINCILNAIYLKIILRDIRKTLLWIMLANNIIIMIIKNDIFFVNATEYIIIV